jgi:alpha-glucosidase
MAMGTVDGLRAAMPELRTFVLSRAGSPGIQRYAANWMGDNGSRWDHLWMSIPMANGFGLSGQAFVGADVGGFAGHSNGELFLRWLQYGALTPFCRNHSMLGDVDQYAWSWGEAILTQARRAIELRYRLLPYIYSAFITATETGAPVQRPLVFDHQYDAAVRDIDDQYLLGPDLLVAPVYEPRATARQVYLPAGGWYDWHTGERFTGPQFVVAQTPMDRIPLYARAGAVIPMWPSAPASTNERPDTIELHAFAGAAGTSFLQEDDGLTLAGPTRRTWLDLDGETLRARSEGEFPGSRFAVVAHGGRVELIA